MCEKSPASFYTMSGISYSFHLVGDGLVFYLVFLVTPCFKCLDRFIAEQFFRR